MVKIIEEIKVDLIFLIVGKVILVSDVMLCVINCILVLNVIFFKDKESGVKLCSYVIWNSSYFVMGFVNNGLCNIVEVVGLYLVVGGRYYIVVRCDNNVGFVIE